MLTAEQEKDLLELAANFGSRMKNVDRILSSQGKSIISVPALRCSHSGLYYPADVVKNWGTKYGSGLGMEPCSEALNSNYDREPVRSRWATDNSAVMHPVQHTRAQLDFVAVSELEYKAKQPVLMSDDIGMRKRAVILRARQIANPLNKIKFFKGAV